ncbi:MAG: hypothetical protein A3G32_00415 [Deltaproteobacteria bacterium RIFCSPLOWO2_12_FULL_40_28]|nr:MAG: hypothetical protein A3C45_03570 [Deltaproteobacteria bacterium RIFCSPHIGHO2_02_FULL_40_28]OGQ19185.1 MAG: hypothetical protein A3E27_02455 [Deltaproteobacteria bacterium RIFCSPHIGHO2_12_FULL_40_32]OGQ39801.1 MAG: hypothetical protein A3I69_07530 [Deltaproteobacteria bacterium RIFCSPLOWO2_02_FULL_40_36]OGQ53637.1 MAG: hypothetical protein A3G32_00415 [Deltaproteobacteria bacterium RIFCSPLOWO2_12_FULL_40_28]
MLETLIKVVQIFKKEKIEYCLIGGLAMLLHNGRANTVDMDFYILVNDLKKISDLFLKLGYETRSAGDYQIKTKIDNVPIDLLYADHYVGADVVHRAVEKKLGNIFIRIATPEDLIVLKSIADRSIDKRDIEELRELFGKKLDEDYIEKKLRYVKKLLS